MKTGLKRILVSFVILSALAVLTLTLQASAAGSRSGTGSGGFFIGSIPSSVSCNGGGKVTFSDDELKVWFNGTLLTKGKDYKTSYKNNTSVFELEKGETFATLPAGRKDAAPVVTVTGTGSYEGSVSRHFQITALPIRSARILSDPILCVKESASAASPRVILQTEAANGKSYTLKAGKDYTLSFHRLTRDESGNITQIALDQDSSGKKSPGEYLINVHGIGNFGGSLAEAPTDAALCPILRVLSDADDKAYPSLNQATLSKKLPKQDFALDQETGLPIVRSAAAASALTDGSIKVKLGSRTLVYGQDFIIDDPAAADPLANRYPDGNNYIILLPGPAGTVVGAKRVDFTIAGVSMKEVRFENLASSVPYSGRPILAVRYTGTGAPDVDNARTLQVLARTPAQSAALMKKDGTKLPEEAFRITAEGDNGSLGTVKLTFTGVPEYGVSGSVTKRVKVARRKLAAAEISAAFAEGIDPAAVPYRKAGACPEILVRWTDSLGTERTLAEGSEYTVSYGSNKKVGGTGTVSIKGAGGFGGSLRNVLTFTICEAKLQDAVTLTADDIVKKANAKRDYYRSVPQLTDGGKKLVLNKDYEYAGQAGPVYTFAYDTEIDGVTFKAGTPIEDANADIPSGCEVGVAVEVIPKRGSGYALPGELASVSMNAVYHTGDADIGRASVTIRDLPFAGPGRPVVPEKSDFTTLKLNGTDLGAGDFEIVSCDKNTKVGKATVVIHGLGRYCGTKKCTFVITKGKPAEASENMPVGEGQGFAETVDPDRNTSLGDLEKAGCILAVEQGTLKEPSAVSAKPVDREELAAIGAMDGSRFEKLISPMRITCEGYDRSAFGGEVTLTLPLPDTEDLSRYVFLYYDEENGELRYFRPDSIDAKNATMTLALPHLSLWGGGKLTTQEQIDSFLDEYCMQQAVSNGKYKNAASDLEPYLKKKAEALGLTKEAAADLVQAVINKTSGLFGGKASGLVELGTQHTTTLLRGIYDNDADSIEAGMSDVADAAIQKCWQELRFSERGMSVFTDEAIAGAAGNANALARMIAHFSEGGEDGYRDGMKELGNILQSIHPAAELTTKGARFLGSCANTSFVYWKASEVEELYQIYKNGCRDFWKNEVIPGDRETFLEYLNYSSGFTKAKGIARFYNMDKIEELYERLKFTEFKGKSFAELSENDRNKLEKYAEDGLMEYFELRRAQEKDADRIREKEREIIETMMNSYYGALDSKHFNEFFGEGSEENYDVTFRLQRLINIRDFLSQYVDETALEKGWKDGGENWGDLLNVWVDLAADKNNTRDMAIDDFIDYLQEKKLLKKGIKKKNNSGGGDPPPDIKTGLEEFYGSNGELVWQYFYRDDGTKKWYKYYEQGKLKYHAEYDEEERVVHEEHYDLKTGVLQKEDFWEYQENGEVLKKLRKCFSLQNGSLIEEFEMTPATKEELDLIGYEGDEKRYIVKRTSYHDQQTEGETMEGGDPLPLVVSSVRYAVYESLDMLHGNYDGYLNDFYGRTWYRYNTDGILEKTMEGVGIYWTETNVYYPGYPAGTTRYIERADLGADVGSVTFYHNGGGEMGEEYYGRSRDSSGEIVDQNFMTMSDVSLNPWDPRFDNPWTLRYRNGQAASTITGSYTPYDDGFSCQLNRKDYSSEGRHILNTTLDGDITEDENGRTFTLRMNARYTGSGAEGGILRNYDSFRSDLVNPYSQSEVNDFGWTAGHLFETWTSVNWETTAHEYWRAWEGVNGEYNEWGWYHRDYIKGGDEEGIKVGERKIDD